LYRAIAAVCLAAGLFLAINHPLAPVVCAASVVLWAMVVWRWPSVWLFAVPALLPVMDFLPWTGWITLAEFDLLLLATAAGSYWRLAGLPPAPVAGRIPRSVVVLVLLAWIVACLRGISDAGGWTFDWYAGYLDAMNSLRIFKSLGAAVVLMPPMADLFRRDGERPWRTLAAGIAAGLLLVSLAVLWERSSFPGLVDFSTRYRAVGPFWEMHIGGAALDGYLALATPFAAWALLEARGRTAWAVAAFLAVVSAYACLTTFSRGLYLAVVVSLAVLAWLRLRPAGPVREPGALAGSVRLFLAAAFLSLAQIAFRWSGYRGAALLVVAALAMMTINAWRKKPWWSAGWRTQGGMVVTMLLLVEVVAVINGGSFLLERFGDGQQDFRGRVAHWSKGVATLKGYADWMLGKGLGRLPSWYPQQDKRHELPADLRYASEGGNGYARLAGPPGNKFLAGSFGMGQRISGPLADRYVAAFDVRAFADTPLNVTLCDNYLIYEARCLGVETLVKAAPGWQRVEVELTGRPLTPIPWYSARQTVFSFSVLKAGSTVAIDNVSLVGGGRQWLGNGDFSQGLARWYLSGESYFIPWHIDNLIVELLIDQGVIGLIAGVLFVAGAMRRLSAGEARRNAAAPFVAAALAGYLAVGLFASLMDIPRVAFLFFLLCWLGWLLPAPATRNSSAG